MTNSTPSGVRKHRKSTEPGTCKSSEMFSFFFLQTGWLITSHSGLRMKKQHFIQASTLSYCFFTTSMSLLQPLTQKLRLPIWDAIFVICTHTCTLKHHLATTLNHYTRSLNWKVHSRWVVYLGMGSKNWCMSLRVVLSIE